MIPKLLSIQDYCSLGRCALTMTIPVLSVSGVQPIGLPTSYFSNHPHFSHMYYSDMSEKAWEALQTWKQNKVSFDGIQTGFISSLQEMDVIEEAIRLFHNPEKMLVVDPAMADNGTLYRLFDHRMVEAMKKLTSYATCVTPNYTEALLMTGREYKKECSLEEMLVIAKELSSLGPKYVVMTSMPSEETKVRTCFYDREADIFDMVDTDKIAIYLPGTGDIFTSVLAASLLKQCSIEEAVKRAVNFTYYCVKKTFEKGTNPIEGVVLEECLDQLWGENK